ncbi:MAG: SDR family NAD(P)-dependent oxidoreductase [Solirubrobacteraceae bacterium]
MRTAVITGAVHGIGRAIAERLHATGYPLLLCDVDPAIAETASAIGSSGVGADVASLVVDVSTGAGARELVQSAIDRWGRVDVLVNNAGGGVIRPFLDHDDDSIAETIARNLLTTVHCCQAVIPHMMKNDPPARGSIVNIGAESVRNGLIQHAMYNGAKGGVHGLTSGLAREFAADGVRVNCVAPSIVVTELVQGWIDAPETMPAVIKPVVDQAVTLIPMGRGASVAEVANTVAFLASEEASFVTGQVISVNGGSSMQ